MKITMGSLLACAAVLWAGVTHAQSLVNPNATSETKALRAYMQSVYEQKRIISGQVDDSYLQYIKDTTGGKEPAMMGFDFNGLMPSQGGNHDADKAIAWVKNRGGIAQFQWHWISPNADGDFYSANFKLGDALANPNGQSYKNMIRDIDLVAGELKKLQAAGVPILWRPLHEAEGKWFWWGMSGGDACKKLYRLMYDRFVNVHKLNNLIWVWTSYGTSKENWYPGDDVVDMIVWDYPDYANANSWNQFQQLFGNRGKLFGAGEDGKLIDPDILAQQPWVYFATWVYMAKDPSVKDGKNPKDWMFKVYNDPRVITLSSLGNPYIPPAPNLAQGKTITSSTIEAADKTADKAVDGNYGSRWASSSADDNWISVDLGGMYTINRVVLNWEAAYGSAYAIQVSADGFNWQDIYNTTTGKGGVDDLSVNGNGRFVRMKGIKRGTQWGYSLWEFRVYGQSVTLPSSISSSSVPSSMASSSVVTPVCTKIQSPITATASTIEGTAYGAGLAFDGNTTTRWSSSYADANSLTADLGGLYSLCRIRLNWEAAYASGYRLEVSTDGVTFTGVYNTTTGDGGVDDISVAPPASARFVRLTGTKRATAWGYSLWEVELFGSPITSSSSVPSSVTQISSSSSAPVTGVVQVDVRPLLTGRSVATFTNGKIVSWTQGFDGGWSGEATLAVAQALGNTNPKALPDNGFFPANTRHPEVQLNFSNSDGTSPQSRYVTGTASFTVAVPTSNYSLLHLFALSANGATTVDIDLMYTNGSVRKTIEIPDWFTAANDADRYVLADDLDKWSNTNARMEQGHHYLLGLDLHPDANRTLTSVVVNKRDAGALTFFGATGVAISRASSSQNWVSTSASVFPSTSSNGTFSRTSSSLSSSAISSSQAVLPSSSSISSRVSTPGTFRVDASGNITKNGTVFPVKCGNWFGLEGQFEPKNAANNPGGAPMELLMGNMWWANTGRTIQQTMTEIKAKGVNMIRLPIAPQTLDVNDPQGKGDIRTGGVLKNSASVRQTNARQAMEDFIKLAAQNNIQVLIDIHSCSNYIGWRAGVLDAKPPFVDANRPGYDFTREDWSCAETGNPSSVKHVQAYNEAKWLANIKEVAGLPKLLGVDNIIGIDIFNEPWGYTWEQWKTLSEHAYQTIAATNPDMLVFVEGVSGTTVDGNPVNHGDPATNPNWGENLFGQGINPLDIPKERLVLSPHTYGPSVFVQKQFIDPAQPQCAGLEGDSAAATKCNVVINAAKLASGWDEHFGYLRDQGYAVVVGEFGGNMDWPKKTTAAELAAWSHITAPVDQQWQNTFVDYMKAKNIQACYWSINPESGDTAGWYLHAYDPTSNPGGFGTWQGLDPRKTDMLSRLWR